MGTGSDLEGYELADLAIVRAIAARRTVYDSSNLLDAEGLRKLDVAGG